MYNKKILNYYMLLIIVIFSYLLINLGIYVFSKNSGGLGIALPLFGGGDDGYFYWNQVQNILEGKEWTRTSVYPQILAFFVRLLGINDPLTARLLNLFVFILLIYTIYRIIKLLSVELKLTFKNHLNAQMLILIFLLFYPSLQMQVNLSIYRDTWIYFLYLLSVYFSILIVNNYKSSKIVDWVLYILTLFFLFQFRPYATLASLVGFVIFQINKNIVSNRVAFYGLILGLFFIYYTFLRDFTVPLVNMSLSDVLMFRFDGVTLRGGGSQMMIDLLQPNFLLFLLNYIHSFIGNFIGPLPWHINSVSTLFVFFTETVPMVLIIIYIFRNRSYISESLRYLIWHALVWNSFISIMNDNVGTANPIMYEKATPVFIDSEPNGWNMDPDALEAAFEKYTPKAVLVVHLYGLTAQIERIKEICEAHNVPLIEDAAESLGTLYNDKWTGTYGDYGVFSFNGNKIITTSGGGMLVSNNEEGIAKAKYWATQAREPFRHYEHKDVGYNYRLSNVCAGIGRGQLKVLEERVQQKRHIFESYQKSLADIEDISFITEKENERSNYWLSAMIINPESKVTSQQVIEALDEANIEGRPIWKPMHMQPVFKDYDFVGGNNAESLFKYGLCLPSDSKMSDEDIQRVIDVIRSLWSK